MCRGRARHLALFSGTFSHSVIVALGELLQPAAVVVDHGAAIARFWRFEAVRIASSIVLPPRPR